MADLVRDLRSGVRALLRRPGFAATAILVMGVGIGASMTVITLVDRLFFERPAGVAEPERVVAVYRMSPVPASFEHADYLYYRDGVAMLSGLAAYGGTRNAAFATGGETSGQLTLTFTSENYFDVLGVTPHVGRFFLPEENAEPGANPAVVLGHGFWTRALGADPRTIGSSLTLNGRSFRVVGVAPPGFRGLRATDPTPDAWTTIAMYGALTGSTETAWWERSPTVFSRWLTVVGRLAPGATVEAAQGNLEALSAALEYPERDAGEGIRVMRQHLYSAGQAEALSKLAGMLLAVVAMVLGVACANVAVLLLSRAAGRGREIGVRAAMGAGRGRIFRQLLAENAVLGLAGGALGIAVAYASSDLAASLLPYRFALRFTPDGSVLLVGVALSILTACAVGVAPALLASRADVVTLVGDARVAGTRSRLRDALVVVQVAVSVVLVGGAILFGRSFLAAATQDVGWESEGRIVLRLDLRAHGYDRERGLAFIREAGERLAAIPGVTAVAAARQIPFQGEWSTGVEVTPEAYPRAEPGRINIGLNVVSPGYFDLMGVRIVRGRALGPEDAEGADPAVVVNRTLAERLWPGDDPLGKRLMPTAGPEERTVVGVAEDAVYYELGESEVAQAYVSFEQAYTPGVSFIVHTAGDAVRGTPALQAAVAQIDPTLPFHSVTTLDALLDEVLARYRVSAVLVGLFGALALLLAAAGLYGVVSYLVAQRTREIGVRIALGASRARVARQVVATGLRLSLVGVGVGLLGAMLLRDSVAAMLYEVPAADPWALAGACVTLAAVAVIASVVPARRAARVDPLEAVRAE